MYYDQSSYPIRCEWGLKGIEALASLSDVVVIVDVLSFTTSVEVGVSCGACLLPFHHGMPFETIEAYAREKNALTPAKTRVKEGGFSLSPVSIMKIEAGTRLVLPSINGSTLTLTAAQYAHTIAGCLRNCEAVAAHAQTLGEKITVIACGERWDDHKSLRPAIEDLIGAGAILSYLKGERSPEAELAVAAFQSVRPDFMDTIQGCSSGRELIDRGFREDVEMATAFNVSRCVPVLREGMYVAAAGED